MFKIGGFSKLTKVSVRMLRYYDQVGLLKPGVTDRYTGYRLYTAGRSVILARLIKKILKSTLQKCRRL